LAHQIEFMKTVHMQMNNRHLKPKPGGYFTITSTSFQAPYSKNTVSTAQTQTGKEESRLAIQNTLIIFIEYHVIFESDFSGFLGAILGRN